MKIRCTILALCLIFSCQLVSQNKVKTKGLVEINGIDQWIEAEGKDDTKPVLLFLHGGPGFPSRPYAKKFIPSLRKHFVVVQWDQRAGGLTRHFNPNNEAPTIELLQQDTYEVVEYLRKRFNRDKIYLLGFSWGGFLGLQYAHKYPENLHAYISVSSLIHGDESERRTLALLKEKAAGNPEALGEINRINLPFTSIDELYAQRKWTNALLGGRPYKSEKIRLMFLRWSNPWFPIFQEASSVNLRAAITDLDCPVYIFQSKRDYVTNYSLGEELFEGLKAEDKHLIWFYESTHEIPTDEPRKFSEELIKIGRGVKR